MKKEEDGNKRGYTLYLDEEVISKLEYVAKKQDRTPSRMVNRLLREKLLGAELGDE